MPPQHLEGAVTPPNFRFPQKLVGVMPPNSRAVPPKHHFYLAELLGTRFPLPSGAVWTRSAQPHPVQQNVGLFTSQLAEPHPLSASHPSPQTGSVG